MVSQKLLLLIALRQKLRKKKTKRKRFCDRPILQKRKTKGEFNLLVEELKLFDHELFFRYFRMSPTLFEQLLSMVAP